MAIDIVYFDRRIATLNKAHLLLLKTDTETIDYDMYRSACIKV